MNTYTHNLVDAALERLRAFVRHKNWTKGRLSVEANLRRVTLQNFWEPDWNPTTDTIRKLESVVPPDFDAV